LLGVWGCEWGGKYWDKKSLMEAIVPPFRKPGRRASERQVCKGGDTFEVPRVASHPFAYEKFDADKEQRPRWTIAG